MHEVGFRCLCFPVQIASHHECALDAACLYVWHHKISFDLFYGMKMLPA